MNRTQNTQISFEPYSLIRDIIKNLWTVILAALIGFMGVGIYSRSVYRPEYTSQATLIVNLKNISAYTYANMSVSSEMAQIFKNVFVQPAMTKRAAENLGMSEFSGRISSEVLKNTNIFTLNVTASSPELAYRELCSVLEVYPEISEAVLADSVIDIMRSPTLPGRPSNTISNSFGKTAAFLCAALTLGIIVFLSLMRDTVKDVKSFRRMIDSDLAATVVHEQPHLSFKNRLFGKKSALLVDDSYSSYRFVECYNRLATKLEYMNRTRDAGVFLITSVAENEGKSTIAANIAISLADRGHKVILLDMDFKKPALHKVFDVAQDERPDLGDMLSGEVPFAGYSPAQYQETGLYLAVNFRPHEDYVDWIHSERVGEAIRSFKEGGFDYVIIDTPPLFVAADVPVISKLADATFAVVRTDCVPAADINDAILSLNEEGCTFSGCILNDLHREFSLLGQLGADESGQHSGKYGYYYYNK